MAITLSDEARRYIALFEDVTDVAARDCIVDEEYDRVVFLVPPGQMGQAIGPGGQRVERLEDRIGRTVELVEDADTPEAFVANTLAPAAVYNVTISEGDTTVAYVEVDRDDMGVAIGDEGRTIDRARTLAKRHHDIDELELV
jgi:N utilization substance protein A